MLRMMNLDLRKSLCAALKIVPPDKLIFATLARLIFVPLFALCNVSGTRLTIVFEHSFWPIIFMAFMALSNGYLSTLAMIYGPARLKGAPGVTVADEEIAGSVMIFCLTFGLFTGSMLSYLVSLIVVG